MKILPGTIKYGLVAAGVLFIGACATMMQNQMTQTQNSGAKIHRTLTGAERGWEIPPEANLPKDECDNVTGVLAQYPKSIYKIQIYQNGTVRRTIGNLSGLSKLEDKKEMDAKVTQVAVAAKSTGFTGCTICAGFCVGNSSTSKTTNAKAEELVKQLKPILEHQQAR